MIKNHNELISRYDTRGSGKLRLDVACSLDELAAHKQAWIELTGSVGVKLPTMTYAWFKSRVETQLKRNESWFCLLCYNGERLIGVLPIIATARRPLGSGMLALKTPPGATELLESDGLERQAAGMMLEYINNISPSVISLKLNQLNESSPWLKILDSADNRFIVFKEFYGRNSYLQLQGNFKTYRSNLSKNFKRNLKRRAKKLAQLDNIELDFRNADQIGAEGIEAFSQIEASGWKGRRGTALAQQDDLYDFYRELTENGTETGTFQWHFLKNDGNVIAAQLAAEMAETLIIIKIAFNEDYADYSPGNLLFEQTIKWAYDRENIKLIDCMTDQAWHSNWNMQKRKKFNVFLYPRRIIPVLAGLLPHRANVVLHSLGRKIPGAKKLYSKFSGQADPNQ